MLDSVKPDIIIGVETHIDEKTIPLGGETAIGLPASLYKTFRKDQNHHGGGVLISIRNNLASHRVPELETDCEIVWAAVKLKGKKTLYISSFYRPNEGDEHRLLQLGESLDKLARTPNHIYFIGGDFNFPDWDWNTMTLKPKCGHPRLHKDFIAMLQDHGLEQMVMKPTRMDNTLDLFITNSPQLITRVKILPGLSDHEIPFCEFNIHGFKIKQESRTILLYNKTDWDAMGKSFRTFWTDIKQSQSDLTTDQLWNKFSKHYTDAVNNHVPKKQATTKDCKPWITREIKKLSKKLYKVHKKWLKLRTLDLGTQRKTLRRELHRQTRRQYWKYIDSTLSDNETTTQKLSQKKFFTYIKQQRTTRTGISHLKIQGQLVSDPTAQADALNAQFFSVFSDGRTYTEEEFKTKTDMKPTKIDLTHPNIVVTEAGVLKLLQNLDPHKACVPDQIHPRVLKELTSDIARILKTIFQLSLDTNSGPQDWRDAYVSSIFKKGCHYDPTNYPPVTLTSIPCKLLEHIITRSMMNHFEANNILRNEQQAFRARRSCETQLLDFTEDLNDSIEKGNQSDAVVLDFAKAFEKLNHSLLIHKLANYGVNTETLGWTEAFLTNRRQAVVVNNAKSKWISVQSGVPQGSVVGPALFLAYINDLPDNLDSPTRLFADDTA